MKIQIDTQIAGDSIIQDTMYIDDLELRESITRKVLNTQDKQVHDALTLMGWVPPNQSNWISVKERLPETDINFLEEVLILRENLSIGVGYWLDCGSYTRFKFDGRSEGLEGWKIKPTHWMPLPEPPKVKK